MSVSSKRCDPTSLIRCSLRTNMHNTNGPRHCHYKAKAGYAKIFSRPVTRRDWTMLSRLRREKGLVEDLLKSPPYRSTVTKLLYAADMVTGYLDDASAVDISPRHVPWPVNSKNNLKNIKLRLCAHTP